MAGSPPTASARLFELLRTPPGGRRGAAGRAAVAAMVGWVILGAVLPNGLPLGVILLGVVLGSLNALTAMGLVLIYRSTRVINFAQAEIGGLASALSVLLVTGKGVSYFVAVPIGLVAALLTGALVDLAVVRRLFTAPRLIVTVAMVGVAQILGAGQLILPHLFTDHLAPFTVYTTPFDVSFRVGPILFRGDHILAVAAAVVLLVTISWFLGRTAVGIAIRGAAESPERARLAGIPVRRLSLVTWVVAAGLSGVGALLSAPIVGVNVGALAGPQALIAPLAAAVLARMENIPTAVAASLGIAVIQQGLFWSFPNSSYLDVVLLGLVIGGLALQRHEALREGGDLAGSSAVREPRLLSHDERRNPRVRTVALVGAAVLIATIVWLPRGMSAADVGLLANIAIFGIIALSALVLTGWSGQISLGQFALVGVGAATVGALIVETKGDLFLELLIAGVIAAAVAVALGVATTRISGMFLGVVTLAAAAAFSGYFFNSAYFSLWTPATVPRPALFERISIESNLAFYYFCLFVLFLCAAAVLGFRRSYIGRAVIAARENERASAASALSVARLKLFAFGFSGFLAGIAGGLYVLSLRGFGFQSFTPAESLSVFTMVVIGGLGSMWGALAGAVYVQSVLYFTSGAAQLVGTGGGLLILVLVFPGGLAEVGYRARDRVVAALVGRGNRSASADDETLAEENDAVERAAAGGIAPTAGASSARGAATPLVWTSLEAGYGPAQVLFGVTGQVGADSALAIVGVNGVGKSTLLKTLAGVVPARHGKIELFGKDITAVSADERVRAGLALVVGGAGVFRGLTIDENLRLAAWCVRQDPGAVDELRERVLDIFPPLRGRGRTRAELLSGGEQQMLALAMGLMARPRVLMVDELSLGLAPVVVESLLAVLNDLRSDGAALLVVEQSPLSAAKVAGRICTMERGRLTRSEDASAFLTHHQLWDAGTSEPDPLAPRTGSASDVHAGDETSSGDVGHAPVAQPDDRLAVRVVDVRKSYGGVTAVGGVSLAVTRGEFLGIIGANGAGKTTLLDLVSGFTKPDSGRIQLYGRDITSWPADQRAERGLGRVFQHARLFPNLTVRETVAVGMSRRAQVREPVAHILHVPAATASEEVVFRHVDDVLEQLDLIRYRDAFTGDLSTGTRRAVELACVIANEPDVLLLDEPTAGIAHGETDELAEIITNLHRRSGATFIMIEHDVALIARLSRRLVCMDQGRVIADGRPFKVLNDPAVMTAYLGSEWERRQPETAARLPPQTGDGRVTPRRRALVARPASPSSDHK